MVYCTVPRRQFAGVLRDCGRLLASLGNPLPIIIITIIITNSTTTTITTTRSALYHCTR